MGPAPTLRPGALRAILRAALIPGQSRVASVVRMSAATGDPQSACGQQALGRMAPRLRTGPLVGLRWLAPMAALADHADQFGVVSP